MKKDVITVHVVSDVACPWCYIGKRRLATALERWKGKTVEVTWCPFQLDPNIPASGLDGHTYLLRKFGDLQRIHEMTERLKALGAIEGINFNFGDKWLAVNTLALHQLLHVARDAGYGTLLKERFFKAYFEENLPLNNLEVLQGIMGEFGWEPSTTQEILADKAIATAVQQEIAHYQQLGVSGVPFFIINNKYAISGAQPAKVFLEAFEKLSPIKGDDNTTSCDMGTGLC